MGGGGDANSKLSSMELAATGMLIGAFGGGGVAVRTARARLPPDRRILHAGARLQRPALAAAGCCPPRVSGLSVCLCPRRPASRHRPRPALFSAGVDPP